VVSLVLYGAFVFIQTVRHRDCFLPTLGTGRATVLQGIVHLVIFAAFLFLAVVPQGYGFRRRRLLAGCSGRGLGLSLNLD
jgi:Ca2+/H+ antiporter